jgi:hypothetical protein
MEILIILVVFLATLVFNYFNSLRRDNAEKIRFREFVLAHKSSDIVEYAQAIPADKEFDITVEDEIIDLDQLSPDELLAIKKKEYADQ